MSSTPDIDAQNEASLKTLQRAIINSSRKFSLIICRCNYQSLRERLTGKLRQDSQINFREIALAPETKAFGIEDILQLGEATAISVSGWELTANLDSILAAINTARDEFRKHLPFPLVLWVNDSVLQRLIRVAPDFESWGAVPIEFAMTAPELLDLIARTADCVFDQVLEAGAGRFLDNDTLHLKNSSPRRIELESARQELYQRGVELDLELEASLEFVLALAANGDLERSHPHYERSLSLWSKVQNPIRQGCVFFYLGRWWRRYAVQNRSEYDRSCWQAKELFEQAIAAFTAADRQDLVAKFINGLGEVLQRLGQWDELETVAKNSQQLHRTYPDPFSFAHD